MLKNLTPSAILLFAWILISILCGFLFLMQILATAGWQSTVVTGASDGTEQCEPLQKNIHLFSYSDSTIYTSHYWNITYDAFGTTYSKRICTDDIKNVKTVHFKPDNPGKAEPELTKQYLHDGFIAALTTIIFGCLYFAVRFSAKAERPSI